MPCFAPHKDRSLDWVIFGLICQLVLLCLCISPDVEGLGFATAQHECFGTRRDFEFFWWRFCYTFTLSVGGFRVCQDYAVDTADEVEDEWLDENHEDFGRIGRMVTACICMTGFLLLCAMLTRLDLAECPCFSRRERNPLFQVVFVLFALIIEALLCGALVLGDRSYALDRDEPVETGCENIDRGYGYGLRVIFFLIFWMLALFCFVVWPCGSCADDDGDGDGGAAAAEKGGGNARDQDAGTVATVETTS